MAATSKNSGWLWPMQACAILRTELLGEARDYCRDLDGRFLLLA